MIPTIEFMTISQTVQIISERAAAGKRPKPKHVKALSQALSALNSPSHNPNDVNLTTIRRRIKILNSIPKTREALQPKRKKSANVMTIGLWGIAHKPGDNERVKKIINLTSMFIYSYSTCRTLIDGVKAEKVMEKLSKKPYSNDIDFRVFAKKGSDYDVQLIYSWAISEGNKPIAQEMRNIQRLRQEDRILDYGYFPKKYVDLLFSHLEAKDSISLMKLNYRWRDVTKRQRLRQEDRILDYGYFPKKYVDLLFSHLKAKDFISLMKLNYRWQDATKRQKTAIVELGALKHQIMCTSTK